MLIEAVDDDDLRRAQRIDDGAPLRASLARRFGRSEEARAFGESVVGLYTPRNAAAVELLLQAIDETLPGGRAQAFLRLALLEPLVAGSRLNAIAGGPPDKEIFGYPFFARIDAFHLPDLFNQKPEGCLRFRASVVS